jgi:hypothetical protein
MDAPTAWGCRLGAAEGARWDAVVDMIRRLR